MKRNTYLFINSIALFYCFYPNPSEPETQKQIKILFKDLIQIKKHFFPSKVEFLVFWKLEIT